MDQMTMCNVRGVARGDKPTKNDHIAFPLCLVSFALLVWFLQLLCFNSVSVLP